MSSRLAGAAALEARLREPETNIVPYLTGGYPTMTAFADSLRAVSAVSEAVEIGIPFSDPMADGATIQE
jgi:tryptophan synthase alpha chain